MIKNSIHPLNYGASNLTSLHWKGIFGLLTFLARILKWWKNYIKYFVFNKYTMVVLILGNKKKLCTQVRTVKSLTLHRLWKRKDIHIICKQAVIYSIRKLLFNESVVQHVHVHVSKLAKLETVNSIKQIIHWNMFRSLL